MNPGEELPPSAHAEPPLADAGCVWDVEEAVTLTGFSRTEILRVWSVVGRAPGGDAPRLDADALRLLGELHRLRRQCGLSGPGLEIIAALLAELHELRRELLRRR